MGKDEECMKAIDETGIEKWDREKEEIGIKKKTESRGQSKMSITKRSERALEKRNCIDVTYVGAVKSPTHKLKNREDRNMVHRGSV